MKNTKKIWIIFIYFVLIMTHLFIFSGCQSNDNNDSKEESSSQNIEKENSGPETGNLIEIGIQHHRTPAQIPLHTPDILPTYDPNDAANVFSRDFRHADLSGFDLSDKKELILSSIFDSKTIWSSSLPDDINPELIIENGKNPGLNVRSLHEQGIDGRGIAIGIIDFTLYADNPEYKDNLIHYDEIMAPSEFPEMHASAVASLAVGKNIGVAPKSELYFIGSRLNEDNGNLTYKYYAEALNRLLDINEQLSEDKKIRVISISRGLGAQDDGYKEIREAIDRAKQEGVFIVYTSMGNDDGFNFSGLGRDPMGNPDDVKSYSVGIWQKAQVEYYKDDLFFPMDSRTYAGWNDAEYEWGSAGGWSWVAPYIAGVYALSCQVKPDITPEVFWAAARKTADLCTVDNNGNAIQILILNPVKLIENIK